MNAIISARILAEMAKGASPAEAFDAVLGAGAFATLAGNLYDTLRERQGLS